MRTREEVCRLMGAKDREVDSIVEIPAGTVVNIRGFRTLIHPDGSMTHGVEQPEVEKLSPQGEDLIDAIEDFLGDGEVDVVEELSEEDAQRIADHANAGLVDATVAEVLAWVGDDADRASVALNVEEARDSPRSTLLSALRKLAG